MATVRFNFLCLIGASVGVFSLGFTWGVVEGAPNMNWSLIEFMARNLYFDTSRLFVALFLIGTMMAFITPLGGTLQLTGVGGFLLALEAEGLGIGQGVAVGMASAALVLASLLFPVWVGYLGGAIGAKERLLTASPAEPHRLRLNLACLAGALLGIGSMHLGWAAPRFTLFDHLFGYYGWVDGPLITTAGFVPAAVAFLIGSLIALLTPVGGIAQLLGASIFLWAFIDITARDTSGEISALGPGFYVGIVAAIVVIGSAIYPVGLGYRKGPRPIGERLLVWRIVRHADALSSPGPPS